MASVPGMKGVGVGVGVAALRPLGAGTVAAGALFLALEQVEAASPPMAAVHQREVAGPSSHM